MQRAVSGSHTEDLLWSYIDQCRADTSHTGGWPGGGGLLLKASLSGEGQRPLAVECNCNTKENFSYSWNVYGKYHCALFNLRVGPNSPVTGEKSRGRIVHQCIYLTVIDKYTDAKYWIFWARATHALGLPSTKFKIIKLLMWLLY